MRFLLILLTLSDSVLAAGKGAGHGSPSDLIPSFVNIGILAAILIWKLKKPLKDFFKSKSDSVQTMISSASSKAQEAEAMMAIQKKKNANITEEVSKIEQSSNSFVAEFKTEQEKELAQRILRLKQDATQKIETQKSDLAFELNKKLVNSVIAKTKIAIKNDRGLSDGAADKLLEGIK